MLRLLIVALLLPAFQLAAQKAERKDIAYKHVYKRALRPQVSRYGLMVKDSLLGGKCFIQLYVSDQNSVRDIPDLWFDVHKPDGRETILLTDENGRAGLVVNPGHCRIVEEVGFYTAAGPLELVAEPDKAYTFTLELGYSHQLEVINILSKRPLTEEEIESIVDGYSKRQGIPALVQDGTCIVSWEI